MEFDLDEQQRMMQSSTRRFFQSLGGLGVARNIVKGDDSPLDLVWNGLCDLEYLALLVPEQFGGLELGATYALPMLEEAGRVLAPGPLVETCLFAAGLLSDSTNGKLKEELLSAIAAGQCKIAICHGGADSGFGGAVWHAKEATHFAVVRGSQVFVVPANTPGISVRDTHKFDPTSGTAEVVFDRVALGSDQFLGADNSALRRAFDLMSVGLCCLSTGGMEAVLEMSIEHAKTRMQFGQPIGHFQAVKHRIVEMKVRLEVARSLTYYAAWCVEMSHAESSTAASAAKSYCAEGYVECALDNMRNFGGLGFSYEHDSHLYLRRAKALENYAGSPREHRRRIAGYLRNRIRNTPLAAGATN